MTEKMHHSHIRILKKKIYKRFKNIPGMRKLKCKGQDSGLWFSGKKMYYFPGSEIAIRLCSSSHLICLCRSQDLSPLRD
jgi:hypothetical protein